MSEDKKKNKKDKENDADNVEITSQDLEDIKQSMMNKWRANAIEDIELNWWQSFLAFFSEEYEKEKKLEKFKQQLNSGEIEAPHFSNQKLMDIAMDTIYKKKKITKEKQKEINKQIQQQKDKIEEDIQQREFIDLLQKKEKDYYEKFKSSKEINENELYRLNEYERKELELLDEKIEKQNENFNKILNNIKMTIIERQKRQEQTGFSKEDIDNIARQFALCVEDKDNGIEHLVEKREKYIKECIKKAQDRAIEDNKKTPTIGTNIANIEETASPAQTFAEKIQQKYISKEAGILNLNSINKLKKSYGFGK